jgi:hypothetical protein
LIFSPVVAGTAGWRGKKKTSVTFRRLFIFIMNNLPSNNAINSRGARYIVKTWKIRWKAAGQCDQKFCEKTPNLVQISPKMEHF